jgi:hypothetical protein
MTSEAQRAKGQAILETLIMVLREGQARTNPGTFTTIQAHIHIVADEAVKRLAGAATREEVLEVWLMLHFKASLDANGEKGEPVPQAVGDA